MAVFTNVVFCVTNGVVVFDVRVVVDHGLELPG